MSESKQRIPAIEGWFTSDEAAPHLLGSQCTACKSYFFPKESLYCRNPSCSGREFEEVPLSRTGTVWSFTEHYYQPPAPYVSPEPFVPYTVAAVELAKEKLVVLGQVADGVAHDALRAGLPVELVLETLYQDDESEYLVWKWKPLAA
jgi:uncharacterized OB-fold protein